MISFSIEDILKKIEIDPRIINLTKSALIINVKALKLDVT